MNFFSFYLKIFGTYNGKKQKIQELFVENSKINNVFYINN